MERTTGSRIKELRERRDWSQKYLAKRIGINNSVLSRIEADKRPVENELLKKICEVFDISADILLGRSSVTNTVMNEYDPLQAAKNRLIEHLSNVNDPALIESLTHIAKNIINDRDR